MEDEADAGAVPVVAGAGDWPVDVAPLPHPEPTLAEAVALTHAADGRAADGDVIGSTALRLEALGVLGRRLDDLLALEVGPAPLDHDAVAAVVADLLDATLGRPSTLLATYGSLRPGEANDDVVADLGGTWAAGTLHGDVVAWGAYPVLRWRRGGPPVPAQLLRADALVGAWSDLDAFEGPRYRRRPVLAEVGADPDAAASGWVVATAYVDADHEPPAASGGADAARSVEGGRRAP